MNDNLFDFLGDEQDDLGLPEGSGKFRNTGFIGPVMGQKMLKIWSGDDLALYETGLGSPEDYTREGKEGSYWYYMTDPETAKVVKKALKSNSPQSIWKIAIPKSAVLNSTEKRLENWSAFIRADCVMATLKSGNSRHHLHMIMAPALVQAFALVQGDIKERLWHMDEILLGIDDAEMTKEFSDRMIGDRDATNEDEDNMAKILEAVDGDLELAQSIALGKKDIVVPESAKDLFGKTKIHYTASRLWKRRAALWAALGEPDPKKYIPEGMAETEDGQKHETSAALLNKYLRITTTKWTKPILARFHLITDFRKGAKSKAGKRWSVPVISEVFPNKAAAQAAAEIDLEEIDSDGDGEAAQAAAPAAGPKTQTDSQFPPVPESWKDADGNELTEPWVETIKAEKESLGGVLPNMPQLVALGQKISATPDDIKAWWPLVLPDPSF